MVPPMRMPLALAVLLLAPALTGCLETFHLREHHPGFQCPGLPEGVLTVEVAGAGAPVTRAELVPAIPFHAMTSCIDPHSLAGAARLPAMNATHLQGPVNLTDYRELRVWYGDTLLRIEAPFAVRRIASLHVNLSGANVTLQGNGEPLEVTRVERLNATATLTPVNLNVHTALENGTREHPIPVNSSWNRGIHLHVAMRPAHEFTGSGRPDPSQFPGANLTARLVAPNGTVMAAGTIRHPLDDAITLHLPADAVGEWRLVIETSRGNASAGSVSVQTRLALLY